MQLQVSGSDLIMIFACNSPVLLLVWTQGFIYLFIITKSTCSELQRIACKVMQSVQSGAILVFTEAAEEELWFELVLCFVPLILCAAVWGTLFSSRQAFWQELLIDGIWGNRIFTSWFVFNNKQPRDLSKATLLSVCCLQTWAANPALIYYDNVNKQLLTVHPGIWASLFPPLCLWSLTVVSGVQSDAHIHL